VGASDEQAGHGPPLHLVASYPSDGQGTLASLDADCDEPTPDCPVPTNTRIELRFDRFLLPTGGFLGGVGLYTGNPPANGVGLAAAYDLLERVVVLRLGRTLEPHTLYTVQLVEPTDPRFGFWAFDRAPLAEGPVPLRFSFMTGKGPRPESAAPSGALADTCATMTEGPLSTCRACHRSAPASEAGPAVFPPMGLDLSSTGGLLDTAIRHVAHQTETGSTLVGPGLETPARFGVRMNLIDPASPATSYLMYKLLQKPENYRVAAGEPPCETGYHAPVDVGGCSAPDPEEVARLREWFVRGEPMPQDARAPDGSLSPASTTRAELLRIAAWISQGAACSPSTP